MSEFKEKLKKVERLLKIAQIREEYTGCNNLYDFLGIDRTATKENIKAIIGEKYKFYLPKQNVGDWEILAKEFIFSQRAIEYILCECQSEYDNHLIDLKVKELRKHFISRTRDDRELDSKEKKELIKEGTEIGLSETQIIKIIDRWMEEDGVKPVEASSSSGSSSGYMPFDELLGKTYYEIFGISKDADYSEIKKIYDEEHKKYIDARDKARANARWVLISDGWEILKDRDKRDAYDRKIEEPEPEVEDGQPVLKVICERDIYVYKDVRKGTKFTETIVIKNTHEGQLKGKIVSDAEWLVPERENLTYKHEQALEITVLTSKIPSKTYKVEGNVTLDTNGGPPYVIPFKVILEDYAVELQRFKMAYVPLFASFFGFISSFITGTKLWDIAYATTIPFAIWFMVLRIKEKGITNTVDRIKQIGLGVLIGWVGGWVVFSIMNKIMSDMPHFTGFLMGAYMFGTFTYLLPKQAFELFFNKGIDLSKYHPLLLNGIGAGIIILSIIIHSGGSSGISTPKPQRIQPPAPAPAPKRSEIKVTKAVIAKKLDSNNQPIEVTSSFDTSGFLDKGVVYHVTLEGIVPNKTKLQTQWYRDGNLYFTSSVYVPSYSSGYYYFNDDSFNFIHGNYEVRLIADGHEVDRAFFSVTASTAVTGTGQTSPHDTLPDKVEPSKHPAKVKQITGKVIGVNISTGTLTVQKTLQRKDISVVISCDYKVLTDIKIGDNVTVRFEESDGKKIAKKVTIKRPIEASAPALEPLRPVTPRPPQSTHDETVDQLRSFEPPSNGWRKSSESVTFEDN